MKSKNIFFFIIVCIFILKKDILKLIQNDGYNNISDIIGIDIKNN